MRQALAEFGERAAIAAQTRWLRVERRINRFMHPARSAASGFFDSYPRYYSTIVTGATPNRLNQRHRALITANEAIISGKSVLDIASHDGRWSFAALAIGAKHVCGIEAREHLVINAKANLRAYGVAEDRFRFVQGDVFDEIDGIEPGSIDTVFCFGFLYHTLHHLLLLSKIARLKPMHLIIDTAIDLGYGDRIFVRTESTEDESQAVLAGADHTVTGVPSRGALELMLANFGWTPRYYDWHHAGIRQWDDLVDYHEGWRISLVVDCVD
jgi:methyltransferase family protein